MSKLIPIMVFSLVLAYISDRKSFYEIDSFGEKKYICKEKLFYGIMALGMAVFVGLRTNGNDTHTYQMMYEAIADDLTAFKEIEWLKPATAPGLQFVCACLRNIGATAQDYFMIFALITVSVYLWFVQKYTSNLWMSVYFFITMGVYTFTMAAIKQTVAVAFLLIATDRAIDKKYMRFVFWVLIAELFHPYSFIYLIVPFLFFNPWNQNTYWLLGGTIAVSLGLSRFMSSILAMTDAMGGAYDSSSFIGEGVNIFRVLVVWVPVVISFRAKKFMKENNNRATNLIVNLTMINAMIMFIGLFGTANYFARLANYFLIFQALALPYLFRYFNRESKVLIKIASVICYLLYFYYANVIANGAFDSDYDFITLFEFFEQLF